MLIGKRVLCSLANEYYAPFRGPLVALAFLALSQTVFLLMNRNGRHLAESHPNKATVKGRALPKPLFLTSGHLGLRV